MFKTRWFLKFASKHRIADSALSEAISRAERGLIDADLGGGLLKQRVARPRSGRSGGYRTLIFFRSGSRAVFAFGFAKSDRANIDEVDERELRATADLVLGLTEVEIEQAVATGRFAEVKYDG